MPALSRYDGTTEGSNSPGHPDQHIDALGSNPEEDEGPQNAPVTLEDTTTETTEPEYTTIIVLLEGRGLEIVQEISNSGCNDEEQLFQLETARQDPTLTTNDRHLIIAARLQILYRRRAVQGPTNGQLTSSRASQENVNSSIASPAVVAPMTTNPPHNVQQDHQTPTPTPVPAVPIPTATNPLIDSTIGAFLARHISTLFPNHRAYLAALIVASRNTALPLADRHAITQQINNIFSADLSDISADLPYVSAEIDAQLRRSDPTYDDDMSSPSTEI
ncbi:hypothetical protein T440DRAFT_504677 [Plenodomus tracheiphilus IPT5]|uniref:Uncharacterized protein n=1 Tax=Plenodomus tracheiphilus IPT5 TaxID=1408161 RepID=A0A6A7BM65_9PLEO|nr:hypothetical protein T440DRAFT_504677 [Plenodomus tracheiphilus IPT5]